jgi:4-amino-4-deoxy-L-arabinose transferase-like glycosyltransferase
MLSRKTTGLIVLAGAALALRVGLVLAVSTEHRAPLTYEHGEIAQNLLAGRGFSVRFLGVEGPTSQQAPLYPAMLAGGYWLFGVGTPAAILAVQLLQCLAGTVLVLCVVGLAWSLVPQRPLVGWLAGWGAALYPPHVYMPTHIQVVTWSALLLTLLAAVVLSRPGEATWRTGVVAGALGGLLLLFDPILALSLPILFLALSRRASHSDSVQRTQYSILSTAYCLPPLLMALTTLAVISPWLWRNWRVHGELVFIKSTFGYAFWQGNNPASWGTDKIPKSSAEEFRREHDGTLASVDRALWEARHETYYIDDVLLKPGGYREFAGLSEPQRSRLLGRRAWEFVRDNPIRYAQLCLARLRYFLLFDETNPKAANLVYRAASLAWLLLTAAGLIVCVLDGRFGGVRPHWPLLAIFAAITLFHTLTIVSARFRIPLEPLTFVWCAAAIAWIQSELSRIPSSWPTLSTSSSATSVSISTPLAGAGRSMLTAPKQTSSSRSPSDTSSPTFTSHRLAVTGISPAPKSGSVST